MTKRAEGAERRLWKATLRCRECGTVLNTAEHVPEDRKVRVAMTAPFNCGRCPKGCRPTFSDLNLKTTLDWEEEPPEVTDP
jgi:hypothetical protein